MVNSMVFLTIQETMESGFWDWFQIQVHVSKQSSPSYFVVSGINTIYLPDERLNEIKAVLAPQFNIETLHLWSLVPCYYYTMIYLPREKWKKIK